MKKVPIDQATDDQLAEYCETVLGLNLTLNMRRDEIIARIRTVDDSDVVVVEDITPDQPVNAAPAQNVRSEDLPLSFGGQRPLIGKGAAYKTDPLVTLVIQKEDKPGGDRDVELFNNGVKMFVPRGKLVTIPYRYYESLRLAIKEVITQDDKLNETKRAVAAYPFEVKHMPPDRDIKAWLKRDAMSKEERAADAA